MATGLTVGGWFATAFLDALVDKASSYALQQFGLQSGLYVDLQRLRTCLSKVRVLIGGAEERQFRDAYYILKQLKEAAYDADDLLDEFEYHQLKIKVEQMAEDRSSNQASGFLSSALNFANSLFGDAVNKIREIQERLDSTYADLRDVIVDIGKARIKAQTDVGWPREETSSILTESEVFGRDDERDRVIELLLNSGSNGLSVLPIIGIGGIGKTTLAQLVYHDLKVDAHFELKMWVCASDPFDPKRIIKEIIEYLPGQNHSTAMNLNRLQVILMEKLMSRRFLLVIDDVWNEKGRKWMDLIAPLMVGLDGSKILLTTRSQMVVGIMKDLEIIGMINPIFLNGISADDYWLLFRKCAFGCGKLEEASKLEVMGRKIADKLKGVPLAAKTVGRLLNSSMETKHWRNIMDSQLCELPQNENDLLPVLKLSYQHLPASLKQCFAYCSLFPKDHKFDKHSLVQMWMAQGFVASQRDKRMEDVGNEYFCELRRMSFFQQHSQWDDRYVMHDLFHELARFVSTDECFAVEDGESQEIPDTIRHLSICTMKLEPSSLMEFSSYKKLRSLIFVHGYIDGPGEGSLVNDMLQKLTSIRVLYFGDNNNLEELPDSIGKLKHLRYLCISCPNIRRIPKSLCNLHNLLALKLDWSIEPFPKGMNNLINLRQLDADVDLVSQMAEIGKLTSLQNLREFKVVNESGKTIRELKNMDRLHGHLTILNLENVGSKEDAGQAMLNNKRHLHSLCMQWDSARESNMTINDHDVDVLENLQPHPNLAELEIRGYGGVSSPGWLETPLLLDLESVCLKDCKSWRQLPCLGQLPFLRTLIVKNMHAVRRLDSMFSGSTEFQGFPSLEYLEIEHMPECEGWATTEGSQMLPRLRKVYMNNFPKLRTLPYLERLPSLESIHIGSMPWVTQIGPEFCDTTEFKGFPLLEELEFRDMPEWEEWCSTADGCTLFPCLRSLNIEDCPKLIVLPSIPRSLENLELHKVGLSGLPGLCAGPNGHITQNGTSQVDGNRRSIFLDVSIDECPSLTSLEKLLLQDHLPSIKKLCIRNCGELSYLPVVRFKDLTFLEHLEIMECPKLVSSIRSDENNLLLPASLKTLILSHCGELDVLLPSSLQNIASLSTLEIAGHPHMRWFPSEILRRMTALEDLTIKDCGELRSLGALQYLTSLKSLTILKCPRLTASLQPRDEELANGLPSLLSLWIDDTSLIALLVLGVRPSSLQQLAICHSLQQSLFSGEEESEWLKNLTSLQVLRFIDCAHLQLLPSELPTISTLRSITIDNCTNLMSLPENGLPGSIEELIFWNCHPNLKEWCQKDFGADRSTIAHIPWIHFDGCPIIGQRIS